MATVRNFDLTPDKYNVVRICTCFIVVVVVAAAAVVSSSDIKILAYASNKNADSTWSPSYGHLQAGSPSR